MIPLKQIFTPYRYLVPTFLLPCDIKKGFKVGEKYTIIDSYINEWDTKVFYIDKYDEIVAITEDFCKLSYY